MANQIEEDEPLDPVRVKMVRLLGISIGLMLLALITVLGAVVYKISQGSETAEAEADQSEQNVQPVQNLLLLETLAVDVPEGYAFCQRNSVAFVRIVILSTGFFRRLF